MTTAHGTTTSGTVPQWTLADRLRKAREHTGLEQQEFGELIGVSRATVSNYERGITTNIRRPMLLAWSLGTGVPLQWLSDGTEPTPGDGGDGGVPPAGFEPATYRLKAGRSAPITRIPHARLAHAA